MKTKIYYHLSVLLIILLMASCQKKESALSTTTTTTNEIPASVVQSLKDMGFNTSNVVAAKGGYIVEGDIFIPTDQLGKKSTTPNLIVAKTEQYRTYNLVTSLPRIITISLDPSLTGNYIPGADLAISRWNNLNLLISFQRVNSGGDINITASPNTRYIGYSGFPTSTGNPYNSIDLSTYYIVSTSSVGFIASTIQHEIGHCVGLRHTDYTDRSYSGCAVDANNPANEGSGTDGAINIPGTPTGPEPTSLMLACTPGEDRSFDPADIIALSYLYKSSTIPDLQPIYLFYHSSDHFTTPNYNAVAGLSGYYSGWSYYGIQFKAYLTQVPGTVPVYEFYDSANGGDHFDSTNANAVSGAGSTWSSYGAMFYAYTTQVAGTVPVYLFYDTPGGDHYLTTDPNAVYGLSGWAYYGIAFYAFPN